MVLRSIYGAARELLPFRIRKALLKQYPGRHLHRFLPSGFPLTVHIDPCNICNFKCIFCPTADVELLKEVNRKACIMNVELFRKVIDDLSVMLKRKTSVIHCIHLYKDGEPLLNPLFCDMVRYARRNGVAKVLSTTTNGSQITDELASELVSCGLDNIRISIEHVNNQGYRNICRSQHSYDEILQKVRLLYDTKRKQKSKLNILVKITDTGFSAIELEKFHNDFRPFCDQTKVDTLMGWSDSSRKDFTLGKMPKTGMDGTTRLHDQIICPDPFSKLSVNTDGTVSVCCVDWSHGLIMGNVCENSMEEIWNGEEFKKIRQIHITGNRSQIAVCNSCQYVNGTPADSNLDPYQERLLKYYQ